MTVKPGTLWSGTDSKKFRVIDLVDVDGITWVHYRSEVKGWDQTSAREYSCYLESFVSRFRLLPE